MKRNIIAALALLTQCCLANADANQPSQQLPKLKIFMAGDSTMSIKDKKDWPETGWGVAFATFFDAKVNVINRAKNGRSTRTFIAEGRWAEIESALRPGDYVFIQFGHNDESELKIDRYTSPAQYQANLTRLIRETRAKGAEPILATPITRRYFNGQGIIEPTHATYSPLVEAVAKREGVTYVDLDTLTRAHFQQQGDEASKLRFMHIEPNMHPNYPLGVYDDTHLNQLGAREVAQLVVAELKRIHHPLAHRLTPADPKHLNVKPKP